MLEHNLHLLRTYREQWAEGEVPKIKLQNRLLVGDHGSGKTTLLRQLAYRVATEYTQEYLTEIL